jgi:Tol biopolymer transport system component
LLPLLIVVMTCYSFPFQSLQAQKKLELADLPKLVNLSDPQISPDGKTIVLVVGRANIKMKRFDSELVQVDIATGKQKVLTQDRPTVSQPRSSPKGDQLTFVAKAGQGSDAVTQLFALSMTGGEARQITKAAKGVQHYAWSPDSQSIAYVTVDEPSNKAEVERGNDAFEIGNNDMFLTSAPNPSHIWLIPAQGGEAKRLTSGTWSLPVTIPPGAPSSPLSWSPDGKTIYFVSGRGGFFNVWGIRFDAVKGKPVGDPFQVTSFESPSLMVPTNIPPVELSLTQEKLVLTIAEVSGSIWILDNVGP